MNNNYEISKIFRRIADILESEGVDWKPQAYRKAAVSLEDLDKDVYYIYKYESIEGIKKINGIGKALARKIVEYIKTSKIGEYERIKKDAPYDIEELSSISTVGPKKALKLYKALKIKDLADLKEAAKKGKIRDLEGFGKKSEKEILESIKLANLKKNERVPLHFALKEAKSLKNLIKKKAITVEIAGSIRREKDTIGDIDLLAISKKPKELSSYFCTLDRVKRVLAKGNKKAIVILDSGLQADLRIVKAEEFGAALLYFTGPKEHNIKLRKIAISKGYKLNEYGLFDRKTDKRVAGKDEKDIYNKLDLKYIPPKERKDF